LSRTADGPSSRQSTYASSSHRTIPTNGKVTQYLLDCTWENRKKLTYLFGKMYGKSSAYSSARKLAKSSAEVCEKIWLACHEGSIREDTQAW
jgi:cytochrome P450/NADPH-cytochrome P450 reductase